ncbi:MAG TPA: transglutaminase domain-containing protein, partial [Candidatus Angelobacter sp.]|nr:transglutaminase domain-containing protein [Candidatus Angelobacter sp.]
LSLGALVAAVSAQTAPSPAQSFSPPSRSFQFTYSFTVKDIPPGTKLVRVWVPVAQTDDHQTVRVVETSATVKTRMTKDPEYGNAILFAEIPNPTQTSTTFALVYEVTRKEYSRGDYAQLEKKDTRPGVVPVAMTRCLAPDQLIPTDGTIKSLAVQVTGQQSGTVAKAKAAYDYLFTTMRYDKSGTGWGRGDAVWACDAKHGNCTDFHSPFIGMMRADGIPARFDIGFPLPENKASGDIPGYHCWAEFYSKNIGWIPVDISEAWKAQEKRDYFFGTIDANRIKFSTGRDITLSPKQDGPPLNYFVYPYVEVDGKPYDKLDKKFSFAETTRGGTHPATVGHIAPALAQ